MKSPVSLLVRHVAQSAAESAPRDAPLQYHWPRPPLPLLPFAHLGQARHLADKRMTAQEGLLFLPRPSAYLLSCRVDQLGIGVGWNGLQTPVHFERELFVKSRRGLEEDSQRLSKGRNVPDIKSVGQWR